MDIDLSQFSNKQLSNLQNKIDNELNTRKLKEIARYRQNQLNTWHPIFDINDIDLAWMFQNIK